MEEQKRETNELRAEWAKHACTRLLRERVARQVEQTQLDIVSAGLESSDPKVSSLARALVVLRELHEGLK